MPPRWPALASTPRARALAAGAVAFGLVLAGGGCAEPPSFDVSWTIVDTSASGPPLMTVKQCSEVGIHGVRITVLSGSDGVMVSETEHPCIGGAAGVDGPSLEPGEYSVVIEGLRRTGEAWTYERELDELDANSQIQTRAVARASQTVTIVEGGAAPSLAVELLAPPQCDDGIDNDRDGKVDDRDPGCAAPTDNDEALDLAVTFVRPRVSFLGNPAVGPTNVGVDFIRLTLECVDAEQPNCTLPSNDSSGAPFTPLVRDISRFDLDLDQWPFPVPLRRFQLDGGPAGGDGYDYRLSVAALSNDDDPDGPPLTEAHVVDFTVPAGQGAFVIGDYDFEAERFNEPIVSPIALVVSLALTPEATSGSICELGGFVDGSPLALDRVRIRVTDDQGQALDAASLGLSGNGYSDPPSPLAPVDDGNGFVAFACPISSVRSLSLPWGGYSVEIEGEIAGETCFDWTGDPNLAPQPIGAQEFLLERRLVDGEPVGACRECEVASQNVDCGLSAVCSGGVCVPKG